MEHTKRQDSPTTLPNASPAAAPRMSEPGRLRSLLIGDPDPILLLGAGASVTSGIPSAGTTVERVARWAWCKENGRHPGDIAIRRSDYWPWLLKQHWFSAEKNPADQYPTVIDKLLGVKRDRRDFFEQLISPGVPPREGYRSLAQVLGQGWINTVLTTNFDDCLPQAKTIENSPHNLVVIKTPDDLIRFSSAPSFPQLVYLHGSVEHYSDRNLEDEVQSLDPRITERIWPMLRDHPVIVVGYRGAEPSVMHDLFLNQLENTNRFAQGIYWCVAETGMPQVLAPMVQELASAIGNNFVQVPIRGYDELLKFDIWDQLVASGAQPKRRTQFSKAVGIPLDMQAVATARFADLDQMLLFARLRQYADRLNLSAPERFDQKWVAETAASRDLARNENGAVVPTLAGWLLFANAAMTLAPNAVVRFRAEGPERWLKKCFGDDAELSGASSGDTFAVDREIRGNLWAQLDTLTDLLSLVNTQFRLKEEVSRSVRSYNSLALKEMIVNALVHRDYGSAEAVTAHVFPEKIVVTSPGGLVDEVTAQTAGLSLEAAIKAGRRRIKGYRNPVITDLLYGGGQMDREGSGLSDMWKETVNNNGQVEFGPDEGNTHFVVTLWSRPEAVDEITNTAVAETEAVRFATNILEIVGLPDRVYHAGTSSRTAGQIRREAEDLPVPDGFVQDGRFFTFYNLEELTAQFVTPFDVGDVETLSIEELLRLPNGENIFLKILYDAFIDHFRTLALKVDASRKRAYFPKDGDAERKVTYQGRVRRATRTVVKVRTKRDSTDVSYFEHKALNFSLMAFGGQWTILLSPGYVFTRDGLERYVARERTNSLSTRRAARDFNPNVHNDVNFWAAFVSLSSDGVFALRSNAGDPLAQFAPTILVGNRLPTMSYNATAFGDYADGEAEVDDEFDELDAELTALASERDVASKDEEVADDD